MAEPVIKHCTWDCSGTADNKHETDIFSIPSSWHEMEEVYNVVISHKGAVVLHKLHNVETKLVWKTNRNLHPFYAVISTHFVIPGT